MMRGVVNTDLEATLVIQAFGSQGNPLEVTAVIDTGYSGHLSLPPGAIAAMSLRRLAAKIVRLADKSTRLIPTYAAEVLWDGQRRRLRALALDGDPLIGTALLEGYVLTAEFASGGIVRVEAIP